MTMKNIAEHPSFVLDCNGFIYFIDEEDMTIDAIGNRYCYFKTRHMKYRVISN